MTRYRDALEAGEYEADSYSEPEPEPEAHPEAEPEAAEPEAEAAEESEELESLTLAALKAKAEGLDLPTYGTKAQLAYRIREAERESPVDE